MKPISAPATLKYQQIADELRHQVREGVLRPGDRLPSLAEMQASHQASRPTVESAHALLEKENLIVKRHGACLHAGLNDYTHPRIRLNIFFHKAHQTFKIGPLQSSSKYFSKYFEKDV